MEGKESIYKELEIRNDERRRIGRELHDRLSNNILKLKFRILSLKKNIDEVQYQILIEEVDKIREDTRNISHIYSVHQHLSDEKEIICDLKNEIKSQLIDFTDIHPDIVFFYNYFPKKGKINIENKKIETILLSTQELILNAVKHGKSKEINVNLTRYDDHIIVIIEDDGTGFDIGSNGGIGLINVKERMKSINGIFSIDSTIGNGTISTLNFPLK